MNSGSKAIGFVLGLSAGALVGILFDLSQQKSSQLSFLQGWQAACARQGPRIVRSRGGSGPRIA